MWDLTTTQCVRALYVRSAVSFTALDRADGFDVMAYYKTAAAERLIREAEVYAVDVDMRDIDFREDEDGEFGIMLQARWRPMTGGIILIGGPRDSEQLTVTPQMIGQPLIFPDLNRTPAQWMEADDLYPEPVRNLDYQYAGWHEMLRRWAYRFREN